MMHEDERGSLPNRWAEHGHSYHRSWLKRLIGEPFFALSSFWSLITTETFVFGRRTISGKPRFNKRVSSILSSTATNRRIPLRLAMRANSKIPEGTQTITKGPKCFKIMLLVTLFTVKIVVSCRESFTAPVLSTRLLQSS